MLYSPKHAAPESAAYRAFRVIMTWRPRGKWANRALVTAAIVAFIVAVVLPLTPVRVHLDHAGTYGVSIGTDTSYCSVEVWHPSLTCEHAN